MKDLDFIRNAGIIVQYRITTNLWRIKIGMRKLAWTENLRVDIPSIDAQHKHVLEIMDSLKTAIRSGESSEDITRILNRLIVQAIKHFEYEEELMERAHYPGAAEHAAEHYEFTKKLIAHMERFREKRTSAQEDLLGVLEVWFDTHIEFQDRKYTDSLKEYGIE